MSLTQAQAQAQARAAGTAPAETPRFPGVRPVRVGPASTVLRPRYLVVVGALLVVAAALMAVSVALGDLGLSVAEVLAILVGGGDDGDRFVVLGLRLPRALTGLLVGVALGAAGAITQSVSRNPLASPDVLGVTAGASVGAVAMIVLAPTGGAVLGVPAAALLGGLAAAVAVYALAWRQGVDGFRLVLVGIGVSAFGTSLTTWLLVQAELNDAATATVWLTGSLNGRGWDHVVPVAVTIAVVALLAGPAAFALRALSLGDQTATGLGVRTQVTRLVLVLLAVALASVATAAAGPVPFVALVAPQVALRLTRSPTPPLVASGLLGGCLLLASDVVARTVLPVPLPAGVVTAVIGAPFLLHLLRRRIREVTP
ncbi:iron chelate uptake ABC transporter family permease subunit [Georgenia sp. M64]|uniref:FecCD family ABC transporter permease n=1 Tax=Georgenia sp. M64 TaxID=3120520 RepID=UPI0030E071D2